jgi:hypothetical protein
MVWGGVGDLSSKYGLVLIMGEAFFPSPFFPTLKFIILILVFICYLHDQFFLVRNLALVV